MSSRVDNVSCALTALYSAASTVNLAVRLLLNTQRGTEPDPDALDQLSRAAYVESALVRSELDRLIQWVSDHRAAVYQAAKEAVHG